MPIVLSTPSSGSALGRLVLRPANFEHKLRLLDAEIARGEGRDADAAAGYVEAARSADALGFLQHAALAWELAGRHHAQHGEGAASAAFGEALTRYQAWGAATLVERLRDAEACSTGTSSRRTGC